LGGHVQVAVAVKVHVHDQDQVNEERRLRKGRSRQSYKSPAIREQDVMNRQTAAATATEAATFAIARCAAENCVVVAAADKDHAQVHVAESEPKVKALALAVATKRGGRDARPAAKGTTEIGDVGVAESLRDVLE
jgi:hypothetical protein